MWWLRGSKFVRRLRRGSGYLTECFLEVSGVTYGAATFPIPMDAWYVDSGQEGFISGYVLVRGATHLQEIPSMKSRQNSWLTRHHADFHEWLSVETGNQGVHAVAFLRQDATALAKSQYMECGSGQAVESSPLGETFILETAGDTHCPTETKASSSLRRRTWPCKFYLLFRAAPRP